MGEWTPARVEQILRSAAKARRTIDEGDTEIATSKPISDIRQARRWLSRLDPLDAEVVEMRVSGAPWKPICWRLGMGRATAHRRWKAALRKIADGLKQREATTVSTELVE